MEGSARSWVRVVWLLVAVGGACGACLLSREIIPPLDARQERFRPMLEASVGLLRVAMGAAGVLALFSLALWRRGGAVGQGPHAEPPARASPWPAALLVLVVTALAAPRLGTAFWWDELTTIGTVVRNGPAAILTYSSNANNHVLNSLLMWATSRALGDGEVALHLAPFLFCLAAPQLLYGALFRAAGPRVAFLAGLAAAAHPWLINHGVEARGYAGAVVFGWAAVICFAGLLARGTPLLTAAYVGCCVTAFGFITTTILVPFTHGVIACLLLAAGFRVPALRPYRANAVNLIFACLWVAVLAVLVFGPPLPQLLTYARDKAPLEHLPLGRRLGGEVLAYLTGQRHALPAALVAVAACVGWWVALRRGSPQALRLLALGGLAPAVAAGLYVVLPGSHSSGRFFCFLLLPACLGVGLAADWLARGGPAGRVALGLAACGWLGLHGLEHQRLIWVNRPDLKGLASELRGERVALVGVQADVNVHYFPQAATHQRGGRTTLREAVTGAGVVVEGRARKDNRLDEPDAALVALGFRRERALRSAVPGTTEYVVYRRAPPGGLGRASGLR